ncbi:unnamed protein product [Prunus armeniaca]|uniref:Uncharacterized protein n=1 Tax=Prunus armeniaca TaxID=36596 RepID=A0A6J5X7W1_PRUAR|nr:unnamed protein product [Prunus armeniaca]
MSAPVLGACPISSPNATPYHVSERSLISLLAFGAIIFYQTASVVRLADTFQQVQGHGRKLRKTLGGYVLGLFELYTSTPLRIMEKDLLDAALHPHHHSLRSHWKRTVYSPLLQTSAASASTIL